MIATALLLASLTGSPQIDYAHMSHDSLWVEGRNLHAQAIVMIYDHYDPVNATRRVAQPVVKASWVGVDSLGEKVWRLHCALKRDGLRPGQVVWLSVCAAECSEPMLTEMSRSRWTWWDRLLERLRR
jgi:hypothetical protein